MLQTPAHRIGLHISRWLLAGIVVWMCLNAQAHADVLTVNQETRRTNPVVVAEIYKDPSGTLNIEDILRPEVQRQFKPASTTGGELNFGFTDATYWIKLVLKRTPQASDDWMLEIPYLSLDDLTFYAPGRAPVQVGTDFSSNNKPIFYPLYALPLQLSTEPKTFYLRVQSQYALTVPLTLFNRTAFSREFSDKLLSQAIYFGGLLSLALYNFLLFISLKDRSYLYYTLFALAMGMGMFAGNGYGRLYFWPDAAHWDTISQTTFFSLAGALSLVFTRNFLRTQITMPRIDLWLKVFALSYCLGSALLVISIWAPIPPAQVFEFVLAVTIPTTLCSLLAGIRAYRAGVPSAQYLLLASGMLWLGGVVAALRAFDVLPSNGLTLYALQIGSCLEMLLLSFALAHRIHSERDQRITAQEIALEANNKLLELAKQTEAQLESKVIERTEKLQEIVLNERLIRQQYVRFGAMIAHEFRNPLGIIETQSTLLQRENQRAINKVEDRTETILGATHRLARLFDQWLKSDQLQQPISQAHVTTIPLNALMDPVTRAARGVHREHRIRIETIPSASLQGDPGLLEIALLNLIDNACKYSPANEPVVISFLTREGQVGIAVADKGPGLSPDEYNEIFKPYVRTGNTSSSPGFGLGLAFVAHIAELHHGSIEVSSQLGHGSQFCLWIPCID